MGLTQAKYQALEAAGLVKLFSKHNALWREMAKRALAYTQEYIDHVRRDDVLEALVPALTVQPELREYLSGKKLRQKYWVEYFGDLIIDLFWEELLSAKGARDAGT